MIGARLFCSKRIRTPPHDYGLNARTAYNFVDVFTIFQSRRRPVPRLYAAAVLFLAIFVFSAASTWAQSAMPAGRSAVDRGRILLVLPFDNRTGQPNLDWMREAAAELLSSRFASAGFAPMSRADRMYALDHLGLPQGFQPSRASSIKLAQTLDADWIVVGNYINDGSTIIAEARIVDVPHMTMGNPVSTRGEMRDLIAVFDSLAWKLTRQLDPAFNVSQETFVA